MRDFTRKLLAFGLWVPFSVLSVFAVLILPLLIIMEEWEYTKDVGRAMDKLGAAVLGFGGCYTISAECGSRQAGCWFCRVVSRLLDLLEPGHCVGAARREGLLDND